MVLGLWPGYRAQDREVLSHRTGQAGGRGRPSDTATSTIVSYSRLTSARQGSARRARSLTGALARERGCSVTGIVEEALREYLAVRPAG